MPLAPLAAAARGAVEGAAVARNERMHGDGAVAPHPHDWLGPAAAAHVNSGATDHARVVERKKRVKEALGDRARSTPRPSPTAANTKRLAMTRATRGAREHNIWVRGAGAARAPTRPASAVS